LPKELETLIKIAVQWDISRKVFIEKMARDAARAKRNRAKAREQNPQSVIVGTHDAEAQNYPSLVTSSISTHSEGKKLFLSIAYLLDLLLTHQHGDWRRIINDETDKASGGSLLNGRLCIRTIASKIVDEFPESLGGVGRKKTTEKHVKLAVEFLTQEQGHIKDLTAQGKPKAYRTLFGLAKATWRGETRTPRPEIAESEYPPSIHSALSQGLNSTTLVTPDVLERCLENARQQVIKQSSRESDPVSAISS
jgi:hypothetical protein